MEESDVFTGVVRQILVAVRDVVALRLVVPELASIVLNYAGMGKIWILYNIISKYTPSSKILIENGYYEIRIRANQFMSTAAYIDSINRSNDAIQRRSCGRINTMPIELKNLVQLIQTEDYFRLIEFTRRMRDVGCRDSQASWAAKIGATCKQIILTNAMQLLLLIKN